MACMKELKIRLDRNVPNIIIAGPPVVGKTTTILRLAKQLLGPN